MWSKVEDLRQLMSEKHAELLERLKNSDNTVTSFVWNINNRTTTELEIISRIISDELDERQYIKRIAREKD